MHDDGGYAAVRGWVESLPRNAIVRWAADEFVDGEPFAVDWCDVRLIDGPPGFNWHFTVELEGEPGVDASSMVLTPAPDVDVFTVWDTENRVEIVQVAVPSGAKPDSEGFAALEVALGVAAAHEQRIVPGWTASAISRALYDWIESNCARRDLHIEWAADAGPSPMMQDILHTVALYAQNDSGDVYDMGEINGRKILATDLFMDQLLALDPDQAATVMARFRQALGEHDPQ